MVLPWHLYLMASLYFLAGINHFRVPKIYAKIIPPFFFNPKLLNIVAGVTEVLLAIFLCIPTTSGFAALGIIVLLVAVFPANIYMSVNKKASLGFPKWLLLFRLPLQIVLILWAWQYVALFHQPVTN
jgi:uncharacterized membrane protein